MRKPATDLLQGETLLRSAGGGPCRFIAGAQGGHLYLTNKRLFHEPLFGRKTILSIDLRRIAECSVAHFPFFFLMLLFPILLVLMVRRVLRLDLTDGTSVRLNVNRVRDWVNAINTARGGARAPRPRADALAGLSASSEPAVSRCERCGAVIGEGLSYCYECRPKEPAEYA